MAICAVTAAATSLPTAAEAAAPKHGGTLTFANDGLASTLDPDLTYITSYLGGISMGAIYGELAYISPNTGQVKLGFLKSLKPSHDSKVWTLALPKGLKFSDGTPFDAAAIAFNIARGAKANSADQYQPNLATLKTKVVNSTTLQITLPATDTGFPAELTQEFPFIASPSAIQKEGSAFATHPVGAGPFKLVSWVPNSSQTLVRNPYYSSFAPGQPYLDKLVIDDLSTSLSQEVSALSAGTAQMAWASGKTLLQQMQGAGATIQSHIIGGGEWLTFNTTRPPFNNPLAREAVSLALSHQGLADTWAPGSAAMTNLFSKSSPFYSSKYNVGAQDSAKATKLFDQLAASGDPVKFALLYPNLYPQMAGYIQSTLSKYANVSVTLDSQLLANYLQATNDGNFQMSEQAVSFTNPVPVLEQAFETGGPLNDGHWSNPKVDAAIKTLTKTTSPAVEKKEWGIVQQQVLHQWPIFTAQGSDLGLAFKGVGGVTTIQYGTTPLWGLVYRT